MRSIVNIQEDDRFKDKDVDDHVKCKYTPIKSQGMSYCMKHQDILMLSIRNKL